MTQVVMLPKQSSNEIVFRTSLRGDTLIAEGDKNIQRWGNNFSIISVASGYGRLLSVKHAGKTAELDKTGTPSSDLKDTPIEGHWIIRSLLSNAEKNDHTTAPETLRILSTIQYKRR